MIVHGYNAFGAIEATIDGLATTVPNDMGNSHRQMIAEWEAAGNTIPAFEPPLEAASESISDRQFFQGLAIQGEITQEEALAAVKTGDLPQRLEDYIAQLPAEDQFTARMLLSGATTFQRNHPMVALIGDMIAMTSAELDTFWNFCSTL